MDWVSIEPADKTKTYLLEFKSGVICAGKFRLGYSHEPQPGQKGWRSDCCGRWANPKKWAVL